MNAKYLATCAVVGGIILFCWGFVTHRAIPTPLREFRNAAVVEEAVQANSDGNGAYFTKRGVFAVVAFEPGVPDKSQAMGPLLLREFLGCAVTGALLGAILAGLGTASAVRGALSLAVMAIAAAFSTEYSSWVWYGFPLPFVGIEALDLVAGWFLTGLALGPLKKKLAV